MLTHFYNKAINGVIPLTICKEINEVYDLVFEKGSKNIEQKVNHIITSLNKVKKLAKNIKDEELANATFILKMYCNLLLEYTRYLEMIEKEKYRESWNTLQNCIDSLKIMSKFENNLALEELNNLFSNLEKLYPFKYFMSIDAYIEKKSCNICGKSLLYDDCEHIEGELYWGYLANGVIEKFSEVNGFAVVENPKNKRCVLEIKDETLSELDKFKCIHFFKNFIRIPFNMFNVHETKETILSETGLTYEVIKNIELEGLNKILKINFFQGLNNIIGESCV